MRKSPASLVFLLVLAGAAVFVWSTSGLLPEHVASHFNAAGQPNGFMPREAYTRVMLVLVLLAPLLVVLLPRFALNVPGARINLPHRDYWLAPERRADTVRRLQEQMTHFGTLLALFLCYVHWLVVGANQATPPVWPNMPFFAGLAVFLAVATGWSLRFVAGFGRIPR